MTGIFTCISRYMYYDDALYDMYLIGIYIQLTKGYMYYDNTLYDIYLHRYVIMDHNDGTSVYRI